MTAPTPPAKFRVLLVGNYLPDEQRSMQRFATQLLDGLNAAGVAVEIFHPPVIAGRLKSGTKGLGKWLGYIDKYLLSPIALRWRIRKVQQPCVVHICDHSNAHNTSALRDVPHLITCHDLLAVRSALGEFEQNRPSWTGRQQQALIVRGLKRAQYICCVSAATADDVARITHTASDRTEVIPNALDEAFIAEATSPTASQAAALPQLTKLPQGARYCLHIGSGAWYKNRATVLKLFASLAAQCADLQLLVVGPEFNADTLSACQCDHLSERIHTLTNLSDAQLRTLYSNTDLLLFPSLIEGFGWPILEAQACGCPVLTLDRAPMNTLNALQSLNRQTATEDWIEQAATECLQQLQLQDTARTAQQSQLRTFAAKFTNQASVDAYLQTYQRLLAQPDSR